MTKECELCGLSPIFTYPLLFLIISLFCSFIVNPLVEKEELFARGVGDGSDIVTKVRLQHSILNIGNVYI